MDGLGAFSKTGSEYQYVVVITNRYSKLTWAVLFSKISSTNLATTIFDHRIKTYGPSSFPLTIYVSQFVFKFFAALEDLLGVEHIATTANHWQTNSQASHFETVVAQFEHFVEEHQHDWYRFV